MSGLTVVRRKGKKVLQFAFLFLGLLVAFFGWFLDHGASFGWVRRVFVFRYDSAVGAYTRLLTDGYITSQDHGFTDFLRAIIDSALVPVVRVEYLAPIAGLSSQGLQQGRSLRFELKDGRHIDKVMDSDGVERLLRDRYLTRPLLGWAQFFMLLGLVITFATGLFGVLKQPA